MPRKSVAMPIIDIVQLIVNRRQRKHEIAATLVFVCTGSAVSAQLCPPKKMLTRAFLTVIYKKVMLCYISRPNGLHNKIF